MYYWWLQIQDTEMCSDSKHNTSVHPNWNPYFDIAFHTHIISQYFEFAYYVNMNSISICFLTRIFPISIIIVYVCNMFHILLLTNSFHLYDMKKALLGKVNSQFVKTQHVFKDGLCSTTWLFILFIYLFFYKTSALSR